LELNGNFKSTFNPRSIILNCVELFELRPEIGRAIRYTGIEGIKDKDTDYKDDILNPNGN